MALLLWLSVTAALARGCLHCNGNFSEKFSFYRHHVDRKSWWVGDITASGLLLTDWSQDTMKELHLAIPAEISECGPAGHAPRPAGRRPRPLTRLPAPPQPGRSWTEWQAPCTGRWISCTRGRCFSRVRGGGPPAPRRPLGRRQGPDFPRLPPSGYFPHELRAVFRKQVQLIQNAIIESEPTRAGSGEGGAVQGLGVLQSPS